MATVQLPLAVTSAEVRSSIHSSAEDFMAQVVDSVEFSCGKLTEAQSNALYGHLQNWLDQAVNSFELPKDCSFDIIPNGKVVSTSMGPAAILEFDADNGKYHVEYTGRGAVGWLKPDQVRLD